MTTLVVAGNIALQIQCAISTIAFLARQTWCADNAGFVVDAAENESASAAYNTKGCSIYKWDVAHLFESFIRRACMATLLKIVTCVRCM